jgi:tetratricopeptide (TPR) repeat protein
MTTDTPAFSNAQLQVYLRDVQEALRAQDMTKALRLSDEAVAKGFEHTNLLVLAAHHQLNFGTIGRAVELATRARELAPRSVDALNALGLSLARQGRGREALPIFDAALRQSPGAVAVRFNKAWTLEQISELKRARIEYERVLDLQPTHVDSLVHLAHLAIQRRDLEMARELAKRALAQDENQPAALLALANADILDKVFDDALRRLEALVAAPNATPINRSIAQGLAGDALEGLGRSADAFAAWSASKTTLRTFYAPVFKARGGEAAHARVSRLTEYFSARPGAAWRDADHSYQCPVRSHVFLVGFPRSGTTLLEQVLAGHPDLESMEERDCLTDALNEFIAPPNAIGGLATLQGTELARYRDLYWKRVAAEGVSLKKPVFLDKMPLNSVVLCVIARLFPQARILFALRDPRDVVFSCFRRRFVMTPQMFELTTLAGAADYYDAVMGLCDVYRRNLGFEFCDTRYEDLVSDFDAQTRKLCAFIGLDWTESLGDFAERARSGTINTPSATQVARGLFTQGMGQWRQYRDELAPVMPRLMPWVSRFGYSAD